MVCHDNSDHISITFPVVASQIVSFADRQYLSHIALGIVGRCVQYSATTRRLLHSAFRLASESRLNRPSQGCSARSFSTNT